MNREIKYFQAIQEATAQAMGLDPRVYVMGLGVPDPGGIFGTTLGLQEKFGERRVMDMPTSENGMTGIAIGSAIVGMRPILTHQRVDFALLSLDQIINNAAKWHFMFGGKMKVPLVIRMIVGRGWGQGPQHSQSLHSIFAHIPGLKVVMPTTPYDAKGLLMSAIEDDNPVIFFEHRWLHNIFGSVPSEPYRVPIGQAKTVREGSDVTIVAASYMVLESLRAADALAEEGIQADVVDLRSMRPLDAPHVIHAVEKTGRLLVVEGGWGGFGFGSEIVALVTENLWGKLKSSPVRISFPEAPTPTSWMLAQYYYPRAIQIVNAVQKMLGRPVKNEDLTGIHRDLHFDVPDKSFAGPF